MRARTSLLLVGFYKLDSLKKYISHARNYDHNVTKENETGERRQGLSIENLNDGYAIKTINHFAMSASFRTGNT